MKRIITVALLAAAFVVPGALIAAETQRFAPIDPKDYSPAQQEFAKLMTAMDFKNKEQAEQVREWFGSEADRHREKIKDIEKEARALQAEAEHEQRLANRFYLGEGFVEVTGESVSVLTDMALRAENIDAEAAEAAVARAQAAMKEDHSSEDLAAIQASFQKAVAQLHVKRRRH